MAKFKEDYANNAEFLIDGYKKNRKIDGAITDILCDLCHLMAREGLNMDEYFREASRNYTDETK